jgi:hypothetical protein
VTDAVPGEGRMPEDDGGAWEMGARTLEEEWTFSRGRHILLFSRTSMTSTNANLPGHGIASGAAKLATHRPIPLGDSLPDGDRLVLDTGKATREPTSGPETGRVLDSRRTQKLR